VSAIDGLARITRNEDRHIFWPHSSNFNPERLRPVTAITTIVSARFHFLRYHAITKAAESQGDAPEGILGRQLRVDERHYQAEFNGATYTRI